MAKTIKEKVNKLLHHSGGNRNLSLVLILFLILSLSFFLRFYRLRDYIIFLGDQGRDVWIVKKMVLDGKFTLLGPVASVGGFYLGPLYYYLITPFLLLSNFDPIGPAIFPALLGSLTPIVLFFYLKKRYSVLTSLISAFLYAISPILIKYNRFSWNPNVVPFFSLIFFITFESFLETKKKKYAILTGFLLGCLFQLHYLAFIFIPVAFIMLLLKDRLLPTLKSSLYVFFGVIVGWFPFILYEVRHKMQNFNGLVEFVSRGDGANVGFDISRYFVTIYTNSVSVIAYLFNFPQIIAVIFLLAAVIYFFAKKSTLSKFIIISFLILSFYKGKMGEHYFNILYVFVVIVLSDILAKIIKSKFALSAAVSIFLIIYFSVSAYPFWKEPNRQLDQTIDISRFILSKYAKNKPFNFALVTSGNNDNAYRYFFDLWGNHPTEIVNDIIDPKRKTVTNKLIVLCEPLAPCTDPRGASLWEIAAFGRGEIVSKEERGVYTIYELTHY